MQKRFCLACRNRWLMESSTNTKLRFSISAKCPSSNKCATNSSRLQVGWCWYKIESVGEEKGWRMLISAVNALTCNMDVIALIYSRYALPNVGLRSLHLPFLSWQIQGYGCPASWRCGPCSGNVLRDTSLCHAAWLSPDVLWALFREGGLFVLFKSYRNTSMGFNRWPPNGGQCVLRSVWDCCCAHRWVSCLLDEVGRIPVTLKHFVEVGFFSLPCYRGATESG